MRSCIVPFCGNSSKRVKHNLQFFIVTPARRELWMVALNRSPRDEVYKNACVCSEHFLPEDFIIVNNKRTLRPGAVPKVRRPSARSIFLYSDRSSVKVAYIPEERIPINSSLLPETKPSTELVYTLEENTGTRSSLLPETLPLNNMNASIEIFDQQISVKKELKDEQNEQKPSTSDDLRSVVDSEYETVVTGVKCIISTAGTEELNDTPEKCRKLIHREHNYSASSRKFSHSVRGPNSRITKNHKELEKQKARINRLQRKVRNLAGVVRKLKRQGLISGNAREVLEKTYAGVPLEIMKRMLTNLEKGNTATQSYPEEIKRFAIALQFYSSEAYSYVRRIFDLALPSANTVRKWMLESNPGFTQQAFNAVEFPVNENEEKRLPTNNSVTLDEMVLKEEI